MVGALDVSSELVCYVIDTSWLVGLLGISDSPDAALRSRFSAELDRSIEEKGRRYVPIPVLFELSNHVSRIRSSEVRDRHARALRGWFDGASQSPPWLFTFTSDGAAWRPEDLQECFDVFVEQQNRPSFGLVDAAVCHEARRLKQNKQWSRRVHIWTTDTDLKALEPDPEPVR